MHPSIRVRISAQQPSADLGPVSVMSIHPNHPLRYHPSLLLPVFMLMLVVVCVALFAGPVCALSICDMYAEDVFEWRRQPARAVT